MSVNPVLLSVIPIAVCQFSDTRNADILKIAIWKNCFFLMHFYTNRISVTGPS